MRIRDEFTEFAQHERASTETHAECVRKDITRFREGLTELAENIGHWAKGTGIVVYCEDVALFDDTVTQFRENHADGCYSTPVISIKNTGKSAVVKAEWLYGFGITGCASLNISGSHRHSKQIRYFLYMHIREQKSDGWTIVRDNQLRHHAEPLTEKSFFHATGLLIM
ncbi:hypothetical protein KFO32_09130 [Pantoea ananatis]|uniref:hypothetical protein n=1 Tax=Pantoea ananas TaxID=553 RepID=UPI001FF12069|nr:hypothetical protein [Pantoea ananatis]MCK0553220.1 hypothetical protein [Pantoea ananatis]